MHASRALVLFEGKDPLPVGLHAHDRPTARVGLVERLVESTNPRTAVIRVCTLSVGVMHDHHQSYVAPRRGVLEHLEVAVGVAECRQRPAADAAVDADRLAGSVVDKSRFSACE
jgi:hypothetical protein